MALYTKINGVWKGVGNSWTPTLSFNANGGTGTMPVYTGFGKFVIPDIGYIRSGFRFLGWNTAPDGSGTTYPVGQQVELKTDITLYAQWMQQFTIRYWKQYNCYWDKIYPPASNSGPVTDGSGNPYYLKVTVGGKLVDGLGDYFKVNNSTSEVRTLTVDKGTELYIQVGHKEGGDTAAVYLNGTIVAGKLTMATYTHSVQSNIDLKLQWTVNGIQYINGKSYWDCYMTTY